MRKKISSKTKFFIIIIFYFVGIAGWYLFGYGFFQNKINNIIEEKKELTINYSQLPKIFKETERSNRLVDSITNETAKIKNKITDITGLDLVKSSFLSFCRRYNIKCDEFSPLSQIYYAKQEDNKEKEYLTLPINIRFNTKYKNFARLLNNLEEFNYNLSIGYLSIIPNDRVENSVLVTLVGNLLVKNELMKQEK